jgi:hypothetical protein
VPRSWADTFTMSLALMPTVTSMCTMPPGADTDAGQVEHAQLLVMRRELATPLGRSRMDRSSTGLTSSSRINSRAM